MSLNRLNAPALCLSGFDPEVIVEQYLKNEYVHLSIDDIPKFISNGQTFKLVQENLPSDFNELKFVIRDPNNNRLVIHTANAAEKDNVICAWHRGRLEKGNRGITIPTSYRTWYSEQLNADVHEFRGERTCCSWSCMIAAMYDSKRYDGDNERLARKLWSIYNPHKPFPEPAQYFGFLENNQGSISLESFKDPNTVNIPVNIISCAEARHMAQISR
jgi:hypothetical protein